MSLSTLLSEYGDLYLHALLNTWRLTALSFAGAFVIGVLVTVLRVCPVKPLRAFGDFFVQVFRNIPGAAMLIILVYALPRLKVLLSYGDGGEPGKAGTSKASMRYMAAWFECFGEKCGFPLKSTFLDMEFAAIQKGSLAWKCLERGGCAVVRVWHGKTGHYVLVTEPVSDAVVGLFDPFAEGIEPCEDYWPVSGEPARKNREVRVEVLNRTDGSHYAMGELERREVLLLWRTDR